MCLYLLFVFSLPEPGAAAYKLTGLVLAVVVLSFLWRSGRRKSGKGPRSLPFIGRRLKVDLLQDRRYRPRTLTLVVRNVSKKDVDILAPVIMFRKLWSIRKFKLKGVDRYEIYPLYLEAGKVHELRINLSAFHDYDRALRKYYWGRVLLRDTNGRNYKTRYVTLRKSLVS